jgi:hypothetical protein
MCGIHKNCGGELFYDVNSIPYKYEGQLIPPLICKRCGEEILGDPEIEDLDGPVAQMVRAADS